MQFFPKDYTRMWSRYSSQNNHQLISCTLNPFICYPGGIRHRPAGKNDFPQMTGARDSQLLHLLSKLTKSVPLLVRKRVSPIIFNPRNMHSIHENSQTQTSQNEMSMQRHHRRGRSTNLVNGVHHSKIGTVKPHASVLRNLTPQFHSQYNRKQFQQHPDADEH